MTNIIPKVWVVKAINQLYEGKTVTAILCQGTLTADSTLAQVLATEIPSSFGYARDSVVAPTAIYDSTDGRAETPVLSFGWVADGGTIQWDAIAYLIGPDASTFTDCIHLDTESPTQNIFDGQPLNVTLDLAGLQTDYV